MKVLGIITILTGVVTLGLTIVGAALAGDRIAWSPILAGLLAIIVGQNCTIIARLQRHLQTTRDKLAEVGSVVRSQESLLANQKMASELQQQGLLRRAESAAEDAIDRAVE